jgi:hypothetical protein
VASRCSHGMKARRNMASPRLQEAQGAQGEKGTGIYCIAASS